MCATNESSVEDETTADSSAEGNEEHVLGILPCTEPEFSECREIDVIF